MGSFRGLAARGVIFSQAGDRAVLTPTGTTALSTHGCRGCCAYVERRYRNGMTHNRADLWHCEVVVGLLARADSVTVRRPLPHSMKHPQDCSTPN
jgi:hypothetical protein